jgi:SH3-like domain-containing protein
MSRLNLRVICRRAVLAVGMAGTLIGILAGTAADVVAQTWPAFASLVADTVEVRNEPGFEKAVVFVFKRAGLPVAVREHAKDWVRVEDTSGTAG